MDSADARLAQAMRTLRRESGRSLKELEKLTATSDSSLSRYVNGTATPPWSVVDALCQTVGRDPGELRSLWEDARRARLDGYGRGAPPIDSDVATTDPARIVVVPRSLVAAVVTVVAGAVVAAIVVLRGRSATPGSVPHPSRGVPGGCESRSGWPT